MAGSSTCQFVGSFLRLDQMPRDGRPQVAFAGRSNVGKSSLLNRLVGRRKMAKVSSTPGKTQALNFFLVDNCFYYVDLPGYGYAKLPRTVGRELGLLLQSYLAQTQNLIGLVLLLDCRRSLTEADSRLLALIGRRQLPVIVAVTKADKVNRDQLTRKVRQVESELGLEAIPFSAVSGIGKRELARAINNLVGEHLGKTKA